MRLGEFSVAAKYTPGKYMTVADALLRAPVTEADDEDLNKGLEVQQFVSSIMHQLPASPNQLKQIKEEQLKDKELSSVIICTLNVWGPELGMPIEISSKCWVARSHLNVVDGTLLLFVGRSIIPCSLRKEMLIRIHSRKRAQVSIWWPELSADLKGWVEGCSFCQRNRS